MTRPTSSCRGCRRFSCCVSKSDSGPDADVDVDRKSIIAAGATTMTMAIDRRTTVRIFFLVVDFDTCSKEGMVYRI